MQSVKMECHHATGLQPRRRGVIRGGLNHLCEVEVPEMFAELIGGLLNGGLVFVI